MEKTNQFYDTFLLYTEKFFRRIKNILFDLTNTFSDMEWY